MNFWTAALYSHDWMNESLFVSERWLAEQTNRYDVISRSELGQTLLSRKLKLRAFKPPLEEKIRKMIWILH